MRDVKLSDSDQMLLTQHLMFLCIERGVDLRIMPGCQVFAYPTIHRIHMVPVEYIEDYCIGLHEIGHCALHHRPEQRREWKEILAWKWGVKNSLFWTRQMDEHRLWCLQCWGITDPDPAKYL